MLPRYKGKIDKGMDALSKESMKFVADCHESIANIPRLRNGMSPDEKEGLKAELEAAVNVVDKENFKLLLNRLQQAEKRYQWWIKTQKSLFKENFWGNYFSTVPKIYQKRYAEIKKCWRSHAAYAHFSSGALSTMAFTILPAYEDYLTYFHTELEIKKNKIDSEVLKDCQVYLVEGQTWLQKTRQILAASMAERLKAASKAEDLTYDDVIHTTVRELQQCKALATNLKIPEPSHGLNQHYFQQFHKYLAEVSPGKAVSLKNHVSWLKSDSQYQTKIEKGRIVIVPRKLESYLTKNRWQRWWQQFTSTPAIENYLSENIYLIAQCRLLEKKVIDLNIEATAFDQNINALAEVREQITQKLETLNLQKPQGIARFFRRSKNKRIQDYEIYWQSQLSLLAEKIISAQEQQMRLWEGKVRLDKQLTFTTTQSSRIERLKEELDNLHAQNGLTQPQIRLMDDLEKRFKEIKEKNNSEKEGIEDYLDELMRGNLKGNGHLASLYHYVDDLQLVEPEQWREFQIKCQPAITKVFSIYESDMKRLLSSYESINDDEVKSLHRALKCLLQLGNEENKKQISKVVSELYGEFCYRLAENKQCEDWFDQVEKILLTYMGKDALDNESLENELEEIRALRQADTAVCREKATRYYHHYYHTLFRENIQQTIFKLRTVLWDNIKICVQHRKETIDHLQKLITAAEEKNLTTLADLPLQPFEKTLLRMHEKNKDLLPFCDRLLILGIQQKKLSTLSEEELKQVKSTLDQELTQFKSVLDQWNQNLNLTLSPSRLFKQQHRENLNVSNLISYVQPTQGV